MKHLPLVYSSSSNMVETSSPNNKSLIEELLRGRDSTKKLQNLLRQDDGSASAHDLVTKILESFSDSLSALSSGDSSPVSATNFVGPACSDDGTLDSGQSEKKPVPAVKDRRGSYKRRKTNDSRVKIVDTIEDGYAWRKYGQKEILNAKFPRCYFRCTHKNEGCKALKQVQKLEDGSEMFHITYFGHHTCHNEEKNTHMFSYSGDLSCFLLNFEDTKINLSPSSPSTITNVNNTSSLVQEDDSNASTNHGQSSMALWKDIFGNLDSSHEDSFNSSGFKFDESLFL